jgi:hypothetical protein
LTTGEITKFRWCLKEMTKVSRWSVGCLVGAAACFLIPVSQAADGKLEGLGPLKLDMAESDVVGKLGGQPRPDKPANYTDEEIDLGMAKFLRMECSASANIKNKKAHVYRLFCSEDVNYDNAQRECRNKFVSIRLALVRYYFGKYDLIDEDGRFFDVDWFYNDKSRATLRAVVALPSPTSQQKGKCVIQIEVSRPTPEAAELVLVPKQR